MHQLWTRQEIRKAIGHVIREHFGVEIDNMPDKSTLGTDIGIGVTSGGYDEYLNLRSHLQDTFEIIIADSYIPRQSVQKTTLTELMDLIWALLPLHKKEEVPWEQPW